MSGRIPTALACLALAAGTAVAGCGNDNKDSASTPAPPPAAAPPPATSKSGGEVVKVGMKNIKFVPQDITAKVGQKIVWTNTDGQISHTVTATKGADFDSGNLAGGATFEYTPKQAGTIDYVCTIHSGQTGSITVTK
jgi:plastocyanin